jgi:hypothetical protein
VLDPDEMRNWRGLAYEADAELVAAVAADGPPKHSLQLVGDGLLEALRKDVDGAAAAATACIGALGERAWPGDSELAEALEVATGVRPELGLRPLPVDLEDLHDVLEGDPLNTSGWLDLATGQVWPQFVVEDAGMLDEDGEIVDPDENPDRWLWVDGEGSHASYADMEDFVDEVEHKDPAFAGRLGRALDGSKPFRRFGEVLDARPDLLTRWMAMRSERLLGRARRWLAGEGWTPVRRP